MSSLRRQSLNHANLVVLNIKCIVLKNNDIFYQKSNKDNPKYKMISGEFLRENVFSSATFYSTLIYLRKNSVLHYLSTELSTDFGDKFWKHRTLIITH